MLLPGTIEFEDSCSLTGFETVIFKYSELEDGDRERERESDGDGGSTPFVLPSNDVKTASA